MKKTLIILKHEFLNVMKRKGFVIMTLIFPVISLIAIGIFQIVQNVDVSDPAETTIIGYVDEVGIFTGYTQWDSIELIPYTSPEKAANALIDEEIIEYIIIPPDYIATGVIHRFTQKNELEPATGTRTVIREFLLNNLLEGHTSEEIQLRIMSPLFLSTIKLDETGHPADDQASISALIYSLVFGLLLIMAIGSSSGYLLQGLGEEKENRIMEILLSSVSTRQLLIGKVLGLGAAGLVQIVIWLLSAALLLQLASNTFGGEFSEIQIPANLLILRIVYFILGYLLFAVLQATIGAIGTTIRESQQMTVVIILPAMLPYYIFVLFLKDNVDHVIGTILTLIPITAPMMVFIRLGMSKIPVWELLLSMSLLILGIIGGLWLAAKTFRIFLLMYGKTPKLGEIIRLLRQT
ncbi:ABC transporter permease [Chloroflexota bacterium]